MGFSMYFNSEEAPGSQSVLLLNSKVWSLPTDFLIL
jgi:hypothetical protein